MIIIIPIVALIANLTYHYIKYSITYIKWEKEPNLNIYTLNKFNLLFVFVESTSTQTFKDLLSHLSSSKALN